MRSSTTEASIEVGDDLILHVSRMGSGPPVVLLHGFTGSSETWSSLVDCLGSFETIAIDLPGHGKSSHPASAERYQLSRLAGDLAFVLDALSLERVAMLGYSMGGRAALHFALGHADRVAALVLESTSPGIPDDAVRHERVNQDRALADVIEIEGVEAFVDKWERLPLWSTQNLLPPQKRTELRAQRLRNAGVGLANSLRGAGAGMTGDLTSRLPGIIAPSLLIAGALDEKYVDYANTLAGILPHAATRIVPNAGHTVHFEKPAEFNSAVRSWLETVPYTERGWI